MAICRLAGCTAVALVLLAGGVLSGTEPALAAEMAGQAGGGAGGAAGRGDGVRGDISRWVAPYFTDADRVPSYAMEKRLNPTSPTPPGVIVPTFERMADGKHRARVEIGAGTSLYGTGEVGGPLLRNGRTVVTWNTDAFGYKPDTPSLYQSHPWVLAVRADGTAFGVLADTTWRCEINLENGIQFTAEGKPFPLYIIERSSPQEVLKGLTKLIDPMPLPPLWAIGYHQCRYSYNPEARVREIASGFRDRDIPADVIWFDIDYMLGFRTFTFSPYEFPDPKKLNEDLGKMGWRRIWMINPGVKADADGASTNDPTSEQVAAASPEVRARHEAELARFRAIRKSGDEQDVWVRNAQGEIYQGAVWPGMCTFPDYTRPEVRRWWAGLYKDFMAYGVDGVWNDMNEPAIFNVASKTMPEDNRHMGGKEPFGDVEPGDHARFHNVYGMLMAKGTYEGIKAANPELRPFVLTRAGYIGSQRYAATWTGDNTADWNDLEQSIPMIINLGISGQPFSGPDIGGFNGNGPRDRAERATHFARWMGIGALFPFSRGHTAKGNIDKEPWSFGPETELVSKLSLQRRYRLMPYYYTLFREASLTSMPVMRPVFFADPKDPALRSEDDSFLIGDAILVVPQLQPDGSRRPVEPRGVWRTFTLVGEDKSPAMRDMPVLKIKGGSIVPAGPIMEFTAEKPLDPLTLLVSLDESGSARGELYEDAGEGFGYQKGEFLATRYSASTAGGVVTIDVAGTDGQMKRPTRRVVVEIITDAGIVRGEGIDGQPIQMKLP
jgi:alpha-glucosidase